MNELSLRLNKFDSLVLKSSELLISDVYLCYKLYLYYRNKEQEILIGITPAGIFSEQFIKSLKLTIEHKLMLHESIIKNLGYYWNEILADRKDKIDVFYKNYEEYTDWVGLKYYLFGTNVVDSDLYLSSWLYNDKDGNIILEVDELFKWSISEKYSENDLEFLEYIKFLKNYKPIIKIVITQGYAMQLLKNLKILYQVFYQNEQKIL